MVLFLRGFGPPAVRQPTRHSCRSIPFSERRIGAMAVARGALEGGEGLKEWAERAVFVFCVSGLSQKWPADAPHCWLEFLVRLRRAVAASLRTLP